MITRNVSKACQKSKRVMAVNRFMNAIISPAFAKIEQEENKIINRIIMNYDLFEVIDACGQFLIYEDTANLWTADVIFDDSYDINKFTLEYKGGMVESGFRDFTFDFDKFFGEKKVDHKINNNKYDHDWVKRGTCVAPFVCSKCGALSGSSAAVSLCGCDNKKVDNDSKFLKERTSNWLPYKMEEVFRFSIANGITLKSAAFYILGRYSGLQDGRAGYSR